MSIPRQLVTQAICALTTISHKRFTVILDDIGVPSAVPSPGEALSKAKDAAARAALVADSDINAVAQRFIERVRQEGTIFHREAFDLEEALWKDAGGSISLPRRVRHELADELDRRAIPVFLRSDAFLKGLESLLLLDAADTFAAWIGVSSSPRGMIEQHMIQNNDYGWSDFFRVIEAEEFSDQRFARLMELLSGPRVRPSVDSQRAVADAANSVLQHCGIELREEGEDGGYPCFVVVSKGGPSRRVKNLIFASAVKPDIVLRDALANEIEVVNHRDVVLIYDYPVGREGLRWCDLQAWWAECRKISDNKMAKRSLYQRLRDSLPSNSPPQKLLFTEYHQWLGARVPEMPALLPEVWLHYDPLTARQRGFDVLLRQRMDFLLLLPAGARIVLEVDGVHHYSDKEGRPSPEEYARMVAADRDLRLGGYEVYRFGGKELSKTSPDDLRPRHLLRGFFSLLFKRHDLTLPDMRSADGPGSSDAGSRLFGV